LEDFRVEVLFKVRYPRESFDEVEAGLIERDDRVSSCERWWRLVDCCMCLVVVVVVWRRWWWWWEKRRRRRRRGEGGGEERSLYWRVETEGSIGLERDLR
jgi:hypothetical protein